jgi:pre-mRNA-processing factor 40
VDRDVNELPYGDERPSSSRRRRPEDDDADRRDSRDTKVCSFLRLSLHETPHTDLPCRD